MKRNEDHAKLDALLNSESQQAMRNAVRSLSDESLSLSWRSELNEKLLQIRPTPRWKVRMFAAWKPAVGLALAACLALVVTVKTSAPPVVHSNNLEASLVSVYDEQATSDEVAGSGLAFHEVNDTTHNTATSSDWNESDLSSL